MAIKYDIFNNYSLFNRAGMEFEVFYDKKDNRFIARTSNARKLKCLVQTPYVESFRREIWKEFWKSLDDESRVLAESFDEKYGFFQFLSENGLIVYYDEAFAKVAEMVINVWETENDLKINWSAIACDWA